MLRKVSSVSLSVARVRWGGTVGYLAHSISVYPIPPHDQQHRLKQAPPSGRPSAYSPPAPPPPAPRREALVDVASPPDRPAYSCPAASRCPLHNSRQNQELFEYVTVFLGKAKVLTKSIALRALEIAEMDSPAARAPAALPPRPAVPRRA